MDSARQDTQTSLARGRRVWFQENAAGPLGFPFDRHIVHDPGSPLSRGRRVWVQESAAAPRSPGQTRRFGLMLEKSFLPSHSLSRHCITRIFWHAGLTLQFKETYERKH